MPKRLRRVRIGRMADPVALCKLLETEPPGNVRLELVLRDGSRCPVAKGIDEAALLRLIEATRHDGDARLELVFPRAAYK